MAVDSDADLLAMFDAEDFGVTASWAPGWERDYYGRTLTVDMQSGAASIEAAQTAMTVIPDEDAQAVPAFGGGPGGAAGRMVVLAPAPAFPVAPEHGDLMEVGAVAFKVEVATSSIDRRVWVLTLSEAA